MADPIGQTFDGVLVTPVVMEVDSRTSFNRALVGFSKGSRVMLAVDTTLPPVTDAEEDGEQLKALFEYIVSGEE